MADAPVTKNNDDNWKRAVELLTGYVLPERSTLFDTLKGNGDIPLMHVRLDRVGGSRYISGFVSSGGWGGNTDFVLPYYRPGSGDDLSHYKAHITLIGRKRVRPRRVATTSSLAGRRKARSSKTEVCGIKKVTMSLGMLCR
jgi:hypothetical protein